MAFILIFTEKTTQMVLNLSNICATLKCFTFKLLLRQGVLHTHCGFICFSARIFTFQKRNKKLTGSSEVSLRPCLYRGATRWSFHCGWMPVSRLILTWNTYSASHLSFCSLSCHLTNQNKAQTVYVQVQWNCVNYFLPYVPLNLIDLILTSISYVCPI